MRRAYMRRPHLAVCALLALGSVGCEATATPSPRIAVRISDTSVITPTVVQEFTQRLPEFDFQVVPRAAQSLTLNALVEGKADVAIVLADTAYFAYASGQGPRGLRGLSVIPELPLQLLARRDKGVHSVTDLRGRRIVACTGCPRVRVGQPGPSEGFAAPILAAYGIDPAQVQGDSFTLETVNEALRSGTYDAALVEFYYPAPVVSAALRDGFTVLPLEGPAIDRLRLQFPFVREVRIPPGTYEGQSEVIRTIGIDRLMLCRSDLDERVAYKLTKAFVEGLQELSSAMHMSFRHMDMERAPATPIPLHEGAARYFREWELFQ